MCGALQKEAKRKLRSWMRGHDIPENVIEALLGPESEDDLTPEKRTNLIRNSPMLVMHKPEGRWIAEMMRWGMLPKWKAEAGDTMPLINAQAENVFSLRTFKDAAKLRRCVIPCGGFFEPKDEGYSAPGSRYLFTSPDEQVFALAAIWSWSIDHSTKEACILTCEPNNLMQTIHRRQPVLLDAAGISAWCDLSLGEGDLRQYLQPCPDEWLHAQQIAAARKRKT